MINNQPRLISEFLEPPRQSLYGLACRYMRLKLNITLSEMSQKIGVSVPKISAIENNRTHPYLAYIDKVEEVLGPLPRIFANVSYSCPFDMLPDEAKEMILEIQERRKNIKDSFEALLKRIGSIE